MKSGLLLLIALTVSLTAAVFAQNDQVKLKTLYEDKHYFELRDRIAADKGNTSAEALFYKGAVYSKFNKADSSAAALQEFISRADTNTALLKEAYILLADNFIKLYRYRDAAEKYEHVLANYTALLDSEETADLKNSARLFRFYANTPAQEIVKTADTKIRTFKDIAGLNNLYISTGKDSINFIFDTGANITTLSASTAKQLGVEIVGDSIMVTSITGVKVPAHLGVLPELHFGNITAKHVLCLIFEDKELSFPQANYFIHGILGFPAIEALGEIEMTKDGMLLVPAVTPERKLRNMGLDELTPIILGRYEGRDLAFTFDTGAKTSMLNYCFYKEYENQVKKNAKQDSVQFGGAGGMTVVPAFVQRVFTIDIAGHTVQIPDMEIIAVETTDDSKHFYGNLGQDLIKQFDKMIINFRSMSIIFQ